MWWFDDAERGGAVLAVAPIIMGADNGRPAPWKHGQR